MHPSTKATLIDGCIRPGEQVDAREIQNRLLDDHGVRWPTTAIGKIISEYLIGASLEKTPKAAHTDSRGFWYRRIKR